MDIREVLDAIDYIRKTLKRNIKKESQKVISFSEIARNNWHLRYSIV